MTAAKTIHVLNLGAGVQSTALALMFDGAMLRNGEEPIRLDAAIFADTQDEPGEVYRHLEWLTASIKSYPLMVRTKGRLSEHLRAGINSTGQRFASIPAFTSTGGRTGQTRRQCSKEYKIEVIEKAIRFELAGAAKGKRVAKSTRIIQYIGISADEIGRAVRIMRARVPASKRPAAERWSYAELIEYFKTRQWGFRFPLVDAGATRRGLVEFLKERVPHETPRSACVFCPYHDDAEWLRIKQNAADWRAAVAVDKSLRTPGTVFNRKFDAPLYLHRSCQPLELVQFKARPVGSVQPSLSFTEDCLGVCGN